MRVGQDRSTRKCKLRCRKPKEASANEHKGWMNVKLFLYEYNKFYSWIGLILDVNDE